MSAEAVEARHEFWKARLPKGENTLWDALTALDGDAQASLFAHCASFAVNALYAILSRRKHAGAIVGLYKQAPEILLESLHGFSHLRHVVVAVVDTSTSVCTAAAWLMSRSAISAGVPISACVVRNVRRRSCSRRGSSASPDG